MKFHGLGPSLPAALVAIVLWVIPLPGPTLALGAELGGKMDTEVEFEGEEDLLPSAVSTDLELAYDADGLLLESETELDGGRYTGQDLLLGLAGEGIGGELDLDFDVDRGNLDSCLASATLDPWPETKLEAAYEAEDCNRYLFGDDRDLEFQLVRDLSPEVSATLSATFSDEPGPLASEPSETELKVDGLPYGDFRLTPVIMLERLEPAGLEVGFERVVPGGGEPRMEFEGRLGWEVSAERVEFDPKFGLGPVTLSLESLIGLEVGGLEEVLEMRELELDGLELGEWGLEVLRDYEDGETEVVLETDLEAAELVLELLFETPPGRGPLLDRLAGEASLELSEGDEVTVEVGTGLDPLSPDLALSSSYSF